MTWTKLSDDYSDDCWTLSDRAFRLHTEALVWNNRKLLDLKIPKDEVRRFAKHPDAVQELLDVGFWTELDSIYIIRHHAAYQRSREAVVRQQEANRANRAKRGQKSGPAREIQGSPAPSNESSNDSLHERDRTGQAREEEIYQESTFDLEEQMQESLPDPQPAPLPELAHEPVSEPSPAPVFDFRARMREAS